MTEFTQHLEEIARKVRAFPETKITKSVFQSFRFVRATEYEAAFSEYLKFRNDNRGLFELSTLIAEPAQSDFTPEGFSWKFETEISGCEIGVECLLENLSACMCILLRDELQGKGINCKIYEGFTSDAQGRPTITQVWVTIGIHHFFVSWDAGFYTFMNTSGPMPLRLELGEIVSLVVTSAQRAQVKK